MPRFGEWLTSVHASDENPHKHGMYVRTIRRYPGAMNPGTSYELTDGNENFWEYPVDSVLPRELRCTSELDSRAVGAAKAIRTELDSGYRTHCCAEWEQVGIGCERCHEIAVRALEAAGLPEILAHAAALEETAGRAGGDDRPVDYRILATALRDLSVALALADARNDFSVAYGADEYAEEVLAQVLEREGDVPVAYLDDWSTERTLGNTLSRKEQPEDLRAEIYAEALQQIVDADPAYLDAQRVAAKALGDASEYANTGRVAWNAPICVARRLDEGLVE